MEFPPRGEVNPHESMRRLLFVREIAFRARSRRSDATSGTTPGRECSQTTVYVWRPLWSTSATRQVRPLASAIRPPTRGFS